MFLGNDPYLHHKIIEYDIWEQYISSTVLSSTPSYKIFYYTSYRTLAEEYALITGFKIPVTMNLFTIMLNILIVMLCMFLWRKKAIQIGLLLPILFYLYTNAKQRFSMFLPENYLVFLLIFGCFLLKKNVNIVYHIVIIIMFYHAHPRAASFALIIYLLCFLYTYPVKYNKRLFLSWLILSWLFFIVLTLLPTAKEALSSMFQAFETNIDFGAYKYDSLSVLLFLLLCSFSTVRTHLIKKFLQMFIFLYMFYFLIFSFFDPEAVERMSLFIIFLVVWFIWYNWFWSGKRLLQIMIFFSSLVFLCTEIYYIKAFSGVSKQDMYCISLINQKYPNSLIIAPPPAQLFGYFYRSDWNYFSLYQLYNLSNMDMFLNFFSQRYIEDHELFLFLSSSSQKLVRTKPLSKILLELQREDLNSKYCFLYRVQIRF